MKLEEKQVNSTEKFSGYIFKVAVDDIELPDGNPAKREVVIHRGAVCIAPLTADNKLYFVRQYRYPMHEILLELPAGRIEAGEDPRNTAERELAEEAGLTVDKCVDMGVSYPTPGYSTEKIYLYAARVSGECDTNPDEGEFVERVELSLEEAVEKVYNGEINDSKTAVLVLKTAKAVKDGIL